MLSDRSPVAVPDHVRVSHEPRRRVRRGMAVALLSQILGAAQLLLLLRVAGASRSVDAYLIGFAFIQAPTAMLVVGVLYPLRLARRREGPWTSEHIGAALAGGIAGAIGLAITSIQQGVDIALPVVLPLVAAGLFASAAAVSGVGLACAGRGEALVGLAVLPNLAALAGLAASQDASELAATSRMSVGLAVGNAVTLVLYHRNWVRASARLGATNSRTDAPLDSVGWLAAGSVVGFGGGLLLQSAAGSLNEGDATVWGVIARLASLVTFVGVTAVVPSVLSWNREAGPELERHLRTVLVLGSLSSLALISGSWLIRPTEVMGTIASLAPLLICWVAAASVGSFLTTSAQRLSLLGAFRASTVLAAPVYVIGAMILTSTGDLEAGAATIAIASSSSCLCMANALGWRRLRPWIVVLIAVTVTAWLV